MVKIEDGKIYEFIETLYGQLNERDGGYYPNKHDKEVFDEASIKFNMSIDELDKIYYSFGKIAGNLKVKNLNNLSDNLREKEFEESLKNL